MIDREKLGTVGELLVKLELLSREELEAVTAFVADGGVWSDALAEADSIHLHARVDDLDQVRGEALLAAGARVENDRPGYVKYAFDGGVNMIVSSLDVAEDDRLPAEHRRPRPHLDHLGIDLRRETDAVRAIFDAAPSRAEALGWGHVPQGSEDKSVFCCHTSVRRKHWVYPDAGHLLGRPIELAFGPLEIHADSMGCDLRPIDPSHPLAASARCAASAKTCSGKAT